MRTADPSKAPRIIDAAAQLFAERPYHEARMDDIAARAGVAKGTLYLHFRDKEALYLALIEDGSSRQTEKVLASVAEASDPFVKLSRFVEGAVEFFDQSPYFLELIPSLDAKLTDKQNSPLQARRREILAIVREILERIDASGRLAVADPVFSAACLLGLIYEVLRISPRPWDASIAGRLEAQFLYGVRGRPLCADRPVEPDAA